MRFVLEFGAPLAHDFGLVNAQRLKPHRTLLLRAFMRRFLQPWYGHIKRIFRYGRGASSLLTGPEVASKVLADYTAGSRHWVDLPD